jgi:hypothetical protein
VLMLPLCCGRNQLFAAQILQVRTRFGTEGSEVRILSPRPKIAKTLTKSIRHARRSVGQEPSFAASNPYADLTLKTRYSDNRP